MVLMIAIDDYNVVVVVVDGDDDDKKKHLCLCVCVFRNVKKNIDQDFKMITLF